MLAAYSTVRTPRAHAISLAVTMHMQQCHASQRRRHAYVWHEQYGMSGLSTWCAHRFAGDAPVFEPDVTGFLMGTPMTEEMVASQTCLEQHKRNTLLRRMSGSPRLSTSSSSLGSKALGSNQNETIESDEPERENDNGKRKTAKQGNRQVPINLSEHAQKPLTPSGTLQGDLQSSVRLSPSRRTHPDSERRKDIRECDMISNIDWVTAKPGAFQNDCTVKESGWVPSQAWFESLRYYPTEEAALLNGENVATFSGNTHTPDQDVDHLETSVRARLGIANAETEWKHGQIPNQWAPALPRKVPHYPATSCSTQPARKQERAGRSRSDIKLAASTATGAARGMSMSPQGLNRTQATKRGKVHV